MTNQQRPIVPPPIVREQWQSESPFKLVSLEREDYMIDCAAQWGADQELEACCEWLTCGGLLPRLPALTESLLAARRPKPPSLKEQALVALRDSPVDPVEETLQLSADAELIIRRALEALPND
jgi:hypothetical protein